MTQNSQYAADLQNVQFKYKHWVLVAQSQRENIKINELVNKKSELNGGLVFIIICVIYVTIVFQSFQSASKLRYFPNAKGPDPIPKVLEKTLHK